jgi:cyclic beta-1,2-glucan synthetase
MWQWRVLVDAHQPTLKRPDLYEAIFSDARAEFRVRERDFDSHTEIVVSPEDDIELRRTAHHQSRTHASHDRADQLCRSGAGAAAADAAHPAFSNLFVQTELVEPLQAILCTRRARASKEAVPWMCHLLAAHGVDIDAISYETDRARFIGRGRSAVVHPPRCDAPIRRRLSNSAGSVLDPIVAIRCASRSTRAVGHVDFVTGMATAATPACT